MGISRPNQLARTRRLGVVPVALAVVCVAAGCVALATASDSHPPKQTAKHHRSDRAGLARVFKLLRSKKPLAALDAVGSTRGRMSLGATGTTGPTGTTGTPTGPGVPTNGVSPSPAAEGTRVLAAAVDWPYTYSLLLKRSTSALDDDLKAILPIVLVRRNAITGERQVLIRIRRAIPWTIRAGGGRAILGLIDVGSSHHIKSRILAFEPGSPTPQTIASGNISGDTDELDNGVCGRMETLNGVGPAGEALITRLTALCTTDRQRDYDIETVAISRDGTTRLLEPTPNLNLLTLGRAELAGDHLLLSGPMVSTINIVNTSSGVKSRIWDGDQQAATSVATDGSVVIGPGSGTDSDYGYPYYLATRYNPFVVFPQADADNPTILTDAGYKSLAMRYCGQRLYELRLPRFVYPDSTADALSLIDGLPVISEMEVIVRDVTGGAARQIATTGEIWVRAINCDGEALVLATDRRSGTDGLRFNP